MIHLSKVYKLCLGYGSIKSISKILIMVKKKKKFGTKILKIDKRSTTFIRGTIVVKCVGLKKKFDLIIMLP